MRWEGRVRGKPTNKSRLTGRCRSGKTRCRSCRDHPVEKSREKRMGRYKRFAADVHTNPALAEFLVQPPLAPHLPGVLMDCDDDEPKACEGMTVELGILAFTVNSIIEAAFAKIQGNDDFEVDAAMGCTVTDHKLASIRAPVLECDGADIATIESALQTQLGIFENAVEGLSLCQLGGCQLSEESWSDVDLLESEQESSEEDDWSVVDGDDLGDYL